MIPKTAHFYWGCKMMPFMRLMTIISFMKHNPDWKVKFYYPETPSIVRSWDSGEHEYVVDCKDYYPLLRSSPVEAIKIDFARLGFKEDISEVYKSDMLRYLLLSTEGGLWSDMDIVYFKSVKVPDADCAVCISSYGHSIGFMMSSPCNNFFNELYHQAKNDLNEKVYQSVGVNMINRHWPTVKSIKDQFNVRVHNLPEGTVYPLNALHIKEIYQSQDYSLLNKDETIGLHWYAGNKLADKVINKTDETNFVLLKNMIGEAFRRSFAKGKYDFGSR